MNTNKEQYDKGFKDGYAQALLVWKDICQEIIDSNKDPNTPQHVTYFLSLSLVRVLENLAKLKP
jgi:hypothetical protein